MAMRDGPCLGGQVPPQTENVGSHTDVRQGCRRLVMNQHPRFSTRRDFLVSCYSTRARSSPATTKELCDEKVDSYTMVHGLFCPADKLAWAGPIWDANADFSTTNGNPNGAWTYGWVDNSFINSFHLDTLANDYGLNGNVPGWCGPIPGPGTGLNFPVIWKNTGPAVSGVQTGQLSLILGSMASRVFWNGLLPPALAAMPSSKGSFCPATSASCRSAFFRITTGIRPFGRRRIPELSILGASCTRRKDRLRCLVPTRRLLQWQHAVGGDDHSRS